MMRWVPRFRFRLRTLLVSAPLLAALLAWSVQRAANSKHHAVAVVLVRSSAAANLWSRETSSDPEGRENLADRTSDDLLLAAIDSLTPDCRARLERRGEPLTWLRRHLRMTFIGHTALVEIALKDDSFWPSNPAAEREIVSAVADVLCGFDRDGVQLNWCGMIER
jgi:hypothetical protein